MCATGMFRCIWVVLILLPTFSSGKNLDHDTGKKISPPQQTDANDASLATGGDHGSYQRHTGRSSLDGQEHTDLHHGSNEEASSDGTMMLSRKARAARRDPWYRWPNGRVPYTIDESLSNMYGVEELIKKSMNYYERFTCVRFHYRKQRDKNYVQFSREEDDRFCGRAHIGNLHEGQQSISIKTSSSFCLSTANILHEIAHALGVEHQHSRPDRDQYVNILEHNLKPEDLNRDLEVLSKTDWTSYGLPYDYQSIMHYGDKAYGINNAITMLAWDNVHQESLTHRANAPSFYDLKLVNLMYHCEDGCNIPCPSTGFVTIVETNCACLCKNDEWIATKMIDNSNYPIRYCEEKDFRDAQFNPPSPLDPNYRPPFASCEDLDPECHLWDITCGTVYMRTNCIRTCSLCEDPIENPGECADFDVRCPDWSANEECFGSYKPFMEDNCKKSCHVCN